MTEKILATEPPTAEEIAAAHAFVGERLDEACTAVPVGSAATWVAVAGTFTTLSALSLGLEEYDPERIHLSAIPFDTLESITDELLAMTPAQRRALGPMHPGRADVIGGGSVVVQELMRRIGRETGVSRVIVSEHDILDGTVYDIFRRLDGAAA